MQTSDYFNIQELRSHGHLTVTNNIVATITDFSQMQGNEQFGAETYYDLRFKPTNPISSDGTIKLTWTNQVNVFEDTECSVETYKALGSICEIDYGSQTIIIHNSFEGVDTYTGPVKIILSHVKNPETNADLLPFVLETFDDYDMQFPIDKLEYQPLLECNYPCFTCSGTDKNFCQSCWPDTITSNVFLMQVENSSTCKARCDDGYTTDGHPEKVCQECDASCATCVDEGLEGDAAICLTCAPGYDLFDAVNNLCLRDCPIGQFKRDKTCYACDENCFTCEGGADLCTSCDQYSAKSFLVGSTCEIECPDRYGSAAGICFECEAPCDTCTTTPTTCSSCLGVDGLDYLYGPTCVNKCPIGFNQNEATFECEGCPSGCFECDPSDQRICL